MTGGWWGWGVGCGVVWGVVGGGKRLSESVGIRGAQSQKEGCWTLTGEFEQTTGGRRFQLASEGGLQ